MGVDKGLLTSSVDDFTAVKVLPGRKSPRFLFEVLYREITGMNKEDII